MADPSGIHIPHIMGVVLDSTGVAGTQVVALNRSTGNRQIKRTTSDKVCTFDAADFTAGYLASDVIEFLNVGSSVGMNTITINSATGGFQETTITCAAAPTVAV